MFEAERDGYFPLELPGGIVLKAVDFETYGLERRALFNTVFPGWTQLDRYRGEIKPHLVEIYQRLHHERFLFYDGDRPVGWASGMMENIYTYRMSSTGILREYRRKGLYSGYVRHLLSYVAALGYERVVSHHHPNNRAVIGAKLKLGFMFSGTLLAEDVGAVTQMLYLINRDRIDAFERTLGLEPDFTRQK